MGACPRALCTSGTATGPNREPGPPEGVGSRSQGEVRLPGSQATLDGSGHTPNAGSSQLPPPRTPAAEMKFGSGASHPFSGGMENAMLWVAPHPAAHFWDAGHCCRDQPENKWLTMVGRNLFFLESGHPRGGLRAMMVYGCWGGSPPQAGLVLHQSWTFFSSLPIPNP